MGDSIWAPAISFEARYGRHLDHGLVLGGGGTFFVAWQVAYLYELSRSGVTLERAERVVGTSAGSIVASVLVAGGLRRLAGQLSLVARLPVAMHALTPSGGGLRPTQTRAMELFWAAQDHDPATVRAIGHAALTAETASRARVSRMFAVPIATNRWPGDSLHITAVDTYTGERLVVRRSDHISPIRAAAASSAVPGIFPPQRLRDRYAMDGGVGGSGTHSDLVAGARKVVVVSLSEALRGASVGGLTQPSGAFDREMEALAASGAQVFLRGPEKVDVNALMDPASIPEALGMGRRQALADAAELRAFLRG